METLIPFSAHQLAASMPKVVTGKKSLVRYPRNPLSQGVTIQNKNINLNTDVVVLNLWASARSFTLLTVSKVDLESYVSWGK